MSRKEINVVRPINVHMVELFTLERKNVPWLYKILVVWSICLMPVHKNQGEKRMSSAVRCGNMDFFLKYWLASRKGSKNMSLGGDEGMGGLGRADSRTCRGRGTH